MPAVTQANDTSFARRVRTDRRRPASAGREMPIPLRIAFQYAGAASLWIVASDYMTDGPLGANHPDWMNNSFKGLLFVAVTAFLLYLLVRRSVQALTLSRQELEESYDATLTGWSRAMDIRDHETENHSERVAELALSIAREFGLSESELIDFRRGALLHDIGKLGVPDSILLKQGPLTDEEWKVMRHHPVLAHDMLAPVKHLQGAADIPYSHHERWDGTGYPRGLKGEEIPLCARIFAVADVWDAIRSSRSYREAWPTERCVAFMREGAGTLFDPRVVEAFLRILEAMDSKGPLVAPSVEQLQVGNSGKGRSNP